MSEETQTETVHEPESVAQELSTSTGSQEAVPVEPSEEEVHKAVAEVLEQYGAGLGVPKILKHLKALNPSWKISEKRLRQLMKDRPRAAARPTPVSKNDAKLQDAVKEMAPLLELKRIDQHKGRGLFAKEEIKEGTVIFQEDAWVFVPTGLVSERVKAGLACAHCGKVYHTQKPTSLNCTFHSPSAKNAACKNNFCSRTCQTAHTQAYGAFTCSLINPAYAELVEWSTETTVALVIFLISARIAVAYSRSEKEGAAELARAEAFTGISERTRREQSATPEEVTVQYETVWKGGYDLVLKALHLEPLADPPLQEKAAQAQNGDSFSTDEKPKVNGDAAQSSVPPQLRLSRPLPSNAAKALLSFDGYLLMHGRVSLNREEDGGLYLLHSSLNHSCKPNCILQRVATKGARRSRILTQDARPSRIYIHCITDISAGEEITLTYVDPQEKVHERRAKLLADYLFTCGCPRCESELGEDRNMKRILEMVRTIGGPNVTATQENGMTILRMGGDNDNTEVGDDLSKIISQVHSSEIENGKA